MECCAVNAVTGTTNDFDNTPWIAGAGGQNIPIFCCSGINADTAGATYTACTNTVTAGYYGIVSPTAVLTTPRSFSGFLSEKSISI